MGTLKGIGYLLLSIVIISTACFSIAFLTTIGVVVGMVVSGILIIGFTAFCLKIVFTLKQKYY